MISSTGGTDGNTTRNAGDDPKSPAEGGALFALEPLREKIAEEIKPALQPHLPPGENADVVAGEVSQRALTVVETQVFQGPIPPPAILEGYDKIVPGAASRLIKMAELEQRHRHKAEIRPMHLDFIYSMTGLIFGFGVALGLIAGAYQTAINGHEAIAGSFLAVGAVSMVAGFIKGRSLFSGNQKSSPEPSSGRAPVKPKGQRR